MWHCGCTLDCGRVCSVTNMAHGRNSVAVVMCTVFAVQWLTHIATILQHIHMRNRFEIPELPVIIQNVPQREQWPAVNDKHWTFDR
jgi:hypothetical protein